MVWKPSPFSSYHFFYLLLAILPLSTEAFAHFSSLFIITLHFLFVYVNDICQNNTMQASTSLEFHLFSHRFHTSLNTPRDIFHRPFKCPFSISCSFIPLPVLCTQIIQSKSLLSLFPLSLLFLHKILHFHHCSPNSFNLPRQTIYFYTPHSKSLPTLFSSPLLKLQLQPPIHR